jgi:GT2 family glycosyltransferase
VTALVPGNRWDLLPAPTARPRVGVVVCHYEQPLALARTLAALQRQTLSPVGIVVADDGSAVRPVPVDGPVPVRVAAQADRGFRAAAARNLGAALVDGDVLVFLDADTTPGPELVEVLTRRASVSPDVLAVGRRRHADLSGTAPGDDPASAPRLPEPRWLADAYRGSRNLLDADGRSFRFVISAVLGCSRALFDDVGGFDERYVGYGGEDWDLAYRAWNAGALLVHEPGAVAWHDGPDWAGRADDPVHGWTAKDRESARLAALVPEPTVRGAPLPGAVPDVLADVDPGLEGPEVVRVVHSLLRQTHRDLRVRLPAGDQAVAELYRGVADDAPWSDDRLRRARARLHVRAALPDDAVARAVDLLVGHDLGRVEIVGDAGRVLASATSPRAAGRGRRHGVDAEPLFGTATVRVDEPVRRDGLEAQFSDTGQRRRSGVSPRGTPSRARRAPR